jgi:hypothetical protein
MSTLALFSLSNPPGLRLLRLCRFQDRETFGEATVLVGELRVLCDEVAYGRGELIEPLVIGLGALASLLVNGVEISAIGLVHLAVPGRRAATVEVVAVLNLGIVGGDSHQGRCAPCRRSSLRHRDCRRS